MLESHGADRDLIKLRFVGPSDAAIDRAIAARGLQDVVEQTGLVSYEESLEEISSASACLLVEGRFDEGVFLPSKLCTYLASRKPVLALSPPVGTVADLAKQGGILRVNVDDLSGATLALKDLFDAYCTGELHKYRPSAELAAEFRPKNVAHRFLQFAANAAVDMDSKCAREACEEPQV
jgi:glycosyltransferase involved in cell wall biosynthesis